MDCHNIEFRFKKVQRHDSYGDFYQLQMFFQNSSGGRQVGVQIPSEGYEGLSATEQGVLVLTACLNELKKGEGAKEKKADNTIVHVGLYSDFLHSEELLELVKVRVFKTMTALSKFQAPERFRMNFHTDKILNEKGEYE
jgi:hypothetical protein